MLFGATMQSRSLKHADELRLKLTIIPGVGMREPALATRRCIPSMIPKRTTSTVRGYPVANLVDVRDAARSSLLTSTEWAMPSVSGNLGPPPTSWRGRQVARGEGVLDSAHAIRRSSLQGVLDSARATQRSSSLSMRPERFISTVNVAKINKFHFEKDGASYRMQESQLPL